MLLRLHLHMAHCVTAPTELTKSLMSAHSKHGSSCSLAEYMSDSAGAQVYMSRWRSASTAMAVSSSDGMRTCATQGCNVRFPNDGHRHCCAICRRTKGGGHSHRCRQEQRAMREDLLATSAVDGSRLFPCFLVGCHRLSSGTDSFVLLLQLLLILGRPPHDTLPTTWAALACTHDGPSCCWRHIPGTELDSCAWCYYIFELGG